MPVILAIEDHPDVLKLKGHEILSAENGQEAMERWQRARDT
ncbi:MAG: hypothetical protein ACFFD4_18825 [Candidatus Odinarchaeota archaeon]